MADDPKRRGPEDPKRINQHQNYEVETWSKHFAVSPAELKGAVDAVGPMVSDVERYLKNKKR